MKRAMMMLHEKYNIEINDQTIEYEIKVQVLKGTSWLKPALLGYIFFMLSIR